jgi:hypothetical protein
MSLIDWMNMNMIADISFLVLSVAVVWKFHKLQKKILLLEKDVLMVMSNPMQARRELKKRRQ